MRDYAANAFEAITAGVSRHLEKSVVSNLTLGNTLERLVSTWESLSEAKAWKKNFRNIKRLDIIKGAGHCPHDEEPEKTNKLICEFLQETK